MSLFDRIFVFTEAATGEGRRDRLSQYYQDELDKNSVKKKGVFTPMNTPQAKHFQDKLERMRVMGQLRSDKKFPETDPDLKAFYDFPGMKRQFQNDSQKRRTLNLTNRKR